MIRFISLVLGGIAALSGMLRTALGAERPNILICVADDWGKGHAGAYDDPAVRTPTFDRIADEGILFDQAFVASPSCTPSRNAMLTGQHFYRLDEGANLRSTLDASHPNFMYLLRNSGYDIAHFRKAWGPGVHQPGGYTEHPHGPAMNFEQFMENRTEDAPFCFWLGTSDPHRPYNADDQVATDPIIVPPYLPDNQITRTDLARYYFEVERWDTDVGRAIALLEQAGELENTIIVITGDNGMPFPRAKGNLYDAGVQVPLAIRWGAGINQPGRRTTAYVSLTDLAPTFLEAAGLEVPEVMTGQPLQPIFQDDQAAIDRQQRDFIVTGRERHAAAQELPSLDGYPSRAIRNDQWLYIANLEPDRWPVGAPKNATHPIGSFPDCDPGPTKDFIIQNQQDPQIRRFYDLCFAKRPADELYDLQGDPHQINNLADAPENRQILDGLRQQMKNYLRDTGDPRFTDEPVRFDDYPYRDDRIHNRIRQWQER